jgi:cell wall-associated NlpC family hydrolase
MAEFHWSSYPGADAYRLQISRSEEFDTLHVDFTVRATTVTELSGLLPIDGSTWYWRVRAEDQGSEWSVPATFVAGRSAEDTERPAESAAAEATASAKGETTEAEAPAEVPFHTARTSGGWALTVGLGMVITFVITLFFIASAV